MIIMENLSARRQTYSSATLSTKNDTCIGHGLKPGLHNNNLVINHLSHDTVNKRLGQEQGKISNSSRTSQNIFYG